MLAVRLVFAVALLCPSLALGQATVEGEESAELRELRLAEEALFGPAPEHPPPGGRSSSSTNRPAAPNLRDIV